MAEWAFDGPIELGDEADPAFEIDIGGGEWIGPVGIPTPGLAPNSVRFEYGLDVTGLPFRIITAPTQVIPTNPPIVIPTSGTVL